VQRQPDPLQPDDQHELQPAAGGRGDQAGRVAGGEFLVSGPLSGTLSDRFGSRGLASGGMLVFGASFICLLALPVDFSYWLFALLITVNGIGVGMFSAPNSSSIMSSVPASQRGAASGMRSTFQSTGTALSIGVFFSLMIAGLASSLPHTLTSGLQQQGVPHAVAQHLDSLPPVSSLFAAMLGQNPLQHLLGSGTVSALPAASQHVLTGTEFFPACSPDRSTTASSWCSASPPCCRCSARSRR
jgi:MFS family permease